MNSLTNFTYRPAPLVTRWKTAHSVEFSQSCPSQKSDLPSSSLRGTCTSQVSTKSLDQPTSSCLHASRVRHQRQLTAPCASSPMNGVHVDNGAKTSWPCRPPKEELHDEQCLERSQPGTRMLGRLSETSQVPTCVTRPFHKRGSCLQYAQMAERSARDNHTKEPPSRHVRTSRARSDTVLAVVESENPALKSPVRISFVFFFYENVSWDTGKANVIGKKRRRTLCTL